MMRPSAHRRSPLMAGRPVPLSTDKHGYQCQCQYRSLRTLRPAPNQPRGHRLLVLSPMQTPLQRLPSIALQR